MKSVFFMTVLMVLTLPGALSAAVPTLPPTGGVAGGVFSLYFQNMVGSVPCPAGSIIKTYDTTPGTNYGKRQCVSLAAGAVKDAFSGFDSTTGAPVYMNAWLKSGTSVYYNTAGGNVGIGTSAPTAKLDVIGNIKASGNISTPTSTVLTSGKIQVLDIVTENAACTPNGLIARDSVGVILSCQSGTWKSITPSNTLSNAPSGITAGNCVQSPNNWIPASIVYPAKNIYNQCGCESGWTSKKTGSDYCNGVFCGGNTNYYTCIKN